MICDLFCNFFFLFLFVRLSGWPYCLNPEYTDRGDEINMWYVVGLKHFIQVECFIASLPQCSSELLTHCIGIPHFYCVLWSLLYFVEAGRCRFLPCFYQTFQIWKKCTMSGTCNSCLLGDKGRNEKCEGILRISISMVQG